MKVFFGVFLTVLSLTLLILSICLGVSSEYKFEREVMSYWNLADKSSTLDAKSGYIDKFVKALDPNKFAEYNAIFLKTPNNSFVQNLDAVKTLQIRLKTIRQIPEDSFAYQSAIQQITAQEQGEAQAMLKVISGCWYLKNYSILWGWIGGFCWTFFYSLLIVLWMIWGSHLNE